MKSVVYLLTLLIACTVEKDPATLIYAPFSQSVVHLNLHDDIKDSTSASASVQTVIPKGGNDSNVVTAKNAGDYYLNIETDRPAKSFLYIGDQLYKIVLIPNDTTHITVRLLQDSIHLDFHGKTKVINEYYLAKNQTLGYSEVRVPLNESLSTTNYNLLKLHTDSVINRELMFFKKYASLVPLPDWFIDYEESEIVYMGAGYKTAIPHLNEMMKFFVDSLPDDYYDFLNHIEVDNPKAVLSANYFLFLDEYFLRTLPVSETSQLNGFSRVNKMMVHKLGQSKVQLSGVIKDIYHRVNFSSMINYYNDSLAIDSLARAFQVSDYKELVRIAGIKSRNEMEKLNLNKGDTIPDFILTNNVDSLISIRTYQDQILYLNFWAPWCGPCIQNMPELNKLIAQYEKRTDIKFINICIDSERDKWLAGLSKYKLRGLNLFAQGNWNSRLRAYFNITGIPHYVIIGKGNLLSENATDKAPTVERKLKVMLTEK